MNDEKPGMFRDYKDMAEKVGTWIGLALVAWAILLGAVYVTVKVVQSLF